MMRHITTMTTTMKTMTMTDSASGFAPDFARSRRGSSLARRVATLALLLGALLWTLAAHAQSAPNPKAAPNDFVHAVAQQALTHLKADAQVRAGNTARVNELIDEYLLPYVDFERTTRLSAGRYWRQASPAQQMALMNAFRGTLIRTYSSALGNIDANTDIRVLPLRGQSGGDADTDDVVVHTQVFPNANAQPVAVDFRLIKKPAGWQIYDVNVEGIWLILNYRNQFAEQINRSGIDGLIAALSKPGS